MRHYAAVVVVVRGEDWRAIVTGVWQQSNNCVNSQSSWRRAFEALRRSPCDAAIGINSSLPAAAGEGLRANLQPLSEREDLYRYGFAVAPGLAAGAVDIGEAVSSAPGDAAGEETGEG